MNAYFYLNIFRAIFIRLPSACDETTSYYYYVYGGGYIVYYTGWTAKRQWCSPFYGFRFLVGIIALSTFSSQTHSCPYDTIVLLSFPFHFLLLYFLLALALLLASLRSNSTKLFASFCKDLFLSSYTQKHGHDAKLVFARASNGVLLLWWQNENKPTQSY